VKRRCVVCWDKPEAPDDWMCKSCGKDYDKHHLATAMNREIVAWTARRARRFERARAKAEALRAMKEDRP